MDSEEWQQCLSLPSIPYVLRMLAGLCKQHTGTQQAAIAAIEKVHLLEQVSTEKHIGTLAENVLETMMENTDCQAEVGSTMCVRCLCMCVIVCVCLLDQGSTQGNSSGEEKKSNGSEDEGTWSSWHARMYHTSPYIYIYIYTITILLLFRLMQRAR